MGVNLLTLARYTLKGPYQAAAVVALLAILAAFVPAMMDHRFFGMVIASLCMFLSSSLVSLIILTQGSASGLKAIVVSMLGISLVSWALVQAPELGLWVGLVQWLPIILLSQTLRSTRSLALTLMAGVGLGAIAIVVQFLLIGTVDVEQIAESFRQMGAQGEQQMIPAEQARDIVQMFVLLMFAMIYLFIMVIIFIARWMQASLAETSGFGEEFRRLALGKNAALFALAILGLGFWLQQGWLVSLLYLLVVAFMFQGIAVVHSKVRQRRQARLILGVFYFLLLIAPQAVALTALTGVIDNWLVFRKQAAKPDNDSDE